MSLMSLIEDRVTRGATAGVEWYFELTFDVHTSDESGLLTPFETGLATPLDGDMTELISAIIPRSFVSSSLGD